MFVITKLGRELIFRCNPFRCTLWNMCTLQLRHFTQCVLWSEIRARIGFININIIYPFELQFIGKVILKTTICYEMFVITKLGRELIFRCNPFRCTLLNMCTLQLRHFTQCVLWSKIRARIPFEAQFIEILKTKICYEMRMVTCAHLCCCIKITII
jgi:hypothetical protein